MTARRLAALAAAAVLVPWLAACGGGLVRPADDGAASQEIRELKARVLELQRQAAVNQVELERLRERVAALEGHGGRSGLPSAPTPTPPAAARPEPPRPRPDLEVVEVLDDDVAEEDMAADELDAPESPPQRPAPSAVAVEVPPATATPPAPSRPPSSAAQALYDRGYTFYHQGRYVDAESTFQRFLQEHPGNDLEDNAQYWIGEARFARGDLRGALAAFRETVERFPTGNKVPDSLLKAGQCLEGIGDVDGARATYREVRRRFPETVAAVVAEERLAALP